MASNTGITTNNAHPCLGAQYQLPLSYYIFKLSNVFLKRLIYYLSLGSGTPLPSLLNDLFPFTTTTIIIYYYYYTPTHGFKHRNSHKQLQQQAPIHVWGHNTQEEHLPIQPEALPAQQTAPGHSQEGSSQAQVQAGSAQEGQG